MGLKHGANHQPLEPFTSTESRCKSFSLISPWESYLTFLWLSFLIWKMGKTHLPSRTMAKDENRDCNIKRSAQCFVYGKCSTSDNCYVAVFTFWPWSWWIIKVLAAAPTCYASIIPIFSHSPQRRVLYNAGSILSSPRKSFLKYSFLLKIIPLC